MQPAQAPVLPDEEPGVEDKDLDRRLRRLYAPYRDVADDEGDERLRERLLRLRTEAPPRSTVGSGRRTGERGHSLRRPRARRPLIAMVVALLGLAFVAGGVYAARAAFSLVDRALLSTPASQQIVEHDLGQAVNLSRQRCGFTVTVGRVYADSHLVVIGYTLRGPAGRVFFGGVGLSSPLLTDTSGHQFLPAEGQFGLGTYGNQTGDFWAFQRQAIPAETFRPSSRPLSLRLTMPAIQLTERYLRPAPRGLPCEKYSREGPADGHWWREVTIDGPFTFTFAVPATTYLRTASLHETGQAEGISVTLDRVEITPSDTRIFWRDNFGHTGPGLSADLAGPALPRVPAGIPPTHRGGKVFVRGFYIGAHRGVRAYTFDIPGYDFHGRWTLLIYNGARAVGLGIPATDHLITLQFRVP